MTSGAAQRERLVTVLTPAVASAGCDLEEVTVSPAGKRKLVRVVVASDAGVTLDEVAAVSRAVTEVLDARDTELFGTSPYVLEVSSPGVDRPLTEPRHWRRAVGRLVEVAVGGVAAPTRARVTAADDDGVELTDEAGTRTRHRWDELGRGKVQVEFGKAAAGEDADDDAEDDDLADDDLADDVTDDDLTDDGLDDLVKEDS